MPERRKLFKIGASQAVTIPKWWIDYHNAKHKNWKVVEVSLRENGDDLSIAPILEEVKE